MRKWMIFAGIFGVAAASVGAAVTARGAEDALVEMFGPRARAESSRRTRPSQLQFMVGQWDVTIQTWKSLSEAPLMGKATSSGELILGGNYIQQKLNGNINEMNLEGLVLLGTDPLRQTYQAAWLDNLGTRILITEGSFTEPNVLTVRGEYAEAASGALRSLRIVFRSVDADHYVTEIYGPGLDGAEMKLMELSFSRQR
jgi:hypothetical protein